MINGVGKSWKIEALAFAINKGNGNKTLFLFIAISNFCNISLNVITSGPITSILFEYISF